MGNFYTAMELDVDEPRLSAEVKDQSKMVVRVCVLRKKDGLEIKEGEEVYGEPSPLVGNESECAGRGGPRPRMHRTPAGFLGKIRVHGEYLPPRPQRTRVGPARLVGAVVAAFVLLHAGRCSRAAIPFAATGLSGPLRHNASNTFACR